MNDIHITHELTGNICFKPALLGGLILYVQVKTTTDFAMESKHWRKATPEDIAELEIHSMISEL